MDHLISYRLEGSHFLGVFELVHADDMVPQRVAAGNALAAVGADVAWVGHVPALDVLVHVVLVLTLVGTVATAPRPGELEHLGADLLIQL